MTEAQRREIMQEHLKARIVGMIMFPPIARNDEPERPVEKKEDQGGLYLRHE